MVRARVATASEGAAPNKFLGLRLSPRTAKAETKRPPNKNRIKTSRTPFTPKGVVRPESLNQEVSERPPGDNQHDRWGSIRGSIEGTGTADCLSFVLFVSSV